MHPEALRHWIRQDEADYCERFDRPTTAEAEELRELRGRFGVEPVLRVLEVKPPTFYGWCRREADPGEREQVDRGLLSKIVEIHNLSGGTYGSPRVHQSLRRRGGFL